MHDDQVIGSDAADALVQKILSNDAVAPSVHALLSDKDVKVAIISELRDVGVPLPVIAYRLIVLAFGGCERFLGGSIKSRLEAYIDNTPVLARILQKILNLQHGAKAKAELKSSLLASLKDGKPIEPNIIPDEASSLEMIVSLHTAKQLEELDDHISKPGDEVIKGFRADLANQLNQLVAPDLGWQDEVVTHRHLSAFQRLMYTSGIDEFLGREDEIDLLDRFAGDPSFGGRVFNFRWMLLTGDAGVGKTRLAYEFTQKRLNDLWYKGKLDFASLKAFVNPSKWRPVKPTFIVIDYVQTVPEEVHALLLAFSCQAKNYEFPVRLLLLERNSDSSWTDKLLPESGDKPVIEQHNFDGQSVLGLEIKPLLPNAIVELMKRRIQKAQFDAPEPSKLLFLAKSVDQRRTSVEVDGRTEPDLPPRPLFAIATAEAIIDRMKKGEELPEHFELTKVLAGIVQRDRDTIWCKTINNDGERRRYEMGLAVATLAQGVSLHDLNKVNFCEGTVWLPPIPPDHDCVSLATFGCCDERWPPMEPDILGEFFVSQQLLTTTLCKIHRFALIEGAISLGERQAVISLVRMARDFPERFKRLQLEEIARSTLRERTLLSLTNLVITLIGHGFGVATRIFDAILERENWKKSHELGILVANAAYNISIFADEANDHARVEEMLGKFDALRKAFPQEQKIALTEAKAAFNIGHVAQKVDNWDSVLARLDALWKAFPQDQEIALVNARAAVNITSYTGGTTGDQGRVAEILTRLDALRKAFPQSQEMALREAMVAVNITNRAGAVGDQSRVPEMLARFDVLRKLFPQDQEIALAEAKASFNIAKYAGTADNQGRVFKMLGRLDALRKAFPQHRKIALAEAEAVVNISNDAAAVGDWDRVTEVLARLDALRTAFPEDQEIAQQEAVAVSNISANAGKTGYRGCAIEMQARLVALRKGLPA